MERTDRPTILVIMGSVRAGRRCPEIAEWVVSKTDAFPETRFETIDLRDWTLPPDDEPEIPAYGTYRQAHTCAWGEKVAAAKAFIIVTPQYNWGYPAPLKNALDHVYKEWAGKPVLIVTYGGHGGDKCASQLRQVCEGLKMRPIPLMPALTLAPETIKGAALDRDRELSPYTDTVEAALRELLALI